MVHDSCLDPASLFRRRRSPWTRPTRSCCAAIRRGRFDRFDDPAEIARFAAAASVFRADELGRPLAVADRRRRSRPGAGDLRERPIALFRGAVRPASGSTRRAGGIPARLRRRPRRQRRAFGAARSAVRRSGAPMAFEAALAVSALSLLSGQRLQEAQDLPELQLAVSRQKPQFQPPVVRHGGLRQPAEGEASLSPPQDCKGR